MIKIVLHYTCKSSYTLYKALKNTPGIAFEMAKTPYFSYLKKYVLSVPAVFQDDDLVLLDPVEPTDVVALKDGKTEKELDIQEAIDNLVRGVMASQALLAIVMLYKSLKPILDPDLVAVLTRAKYHSQQHKTTAIIQKVAKEEDNIIKEHWEYFTKILTLGLVRELYWLDVDIDDIEKQHVKLWLLAKATVGRLGLPTPKPTVPPDVVESIYHVLKESGRRYLDRVVEEQTIINTDEEYTKLLQE